MSSGLAVENDIIEEMTAQVEAEIEADQADPREQSYFMRLDNNTVIKTEGEYMACVGKAIKMRVIPYEHALHLTLEEKAKHKAKIKTRNKTKVARRAKARNR